jgi:putative DNA primase/helicase
MSRRGATFEFDEEDFAAKEANARRVLEEEEADAPEEVKGGGLLKSSKPADIAARYMEVNASVGGAWTLRYGGGEWWQWTGMQWEVVTDVRVEARIWSFLVNSKRATPDGQKRFDPRKKEVTEIMSALRARVITDRPMVAWLGKSLACDPKELVGVQNGILNLRSRELIPHTPRFWCPIVLGFAYDEKAECPRFDQYLGELWPGDADAWRSVFEMIGVGVSYETCWHKGWMFKGPPRSGKGTLAKVLEGVVGEDHFIGMQLDSLSQPFGMQSLIGKKVMCFPDVRSEGLYWRSALSLVQKLLSITGEDKLDVAQKFLKSMNGRLSTRVVMMSNYTIDLRDPTGAIATRWITSEMRVNFLGREELHLDKKLLTERSGILNKSLEAMDKARSRGALTQPESGLELRERLLTGTDLLVRWVKQECVADANAKVSVDHLYVMYRAWMELLKEMDGEYVFVIGKDRFSERLRSFNWIVDGGRAP